MQFEALKVFCDVARLRSFSQAATANRVSQSAASQIVLMLEKRLGGVQLIDRSTRPLQLTELGRLYYEGCKGLVEQYQELEAQVRTAGTRHDANVQVAAIYSVGLGDMGQFVDRFMADNPGARVQIEYLHPDRVYEKVLTGTADFGLVSFPRKSRDMVVLPWRDEEMVLVASPQHALTRQKSVKPAQLAGEKFVGFDRELIIRRQVDRFLREHNAPVEVVMEFDNIENIKKAVEINAGVAILPEPTLRREVEGGTLVALPLAGARLVRPLGILYRRQHKLNFATVKFMELLRQEARTNGASHGRLPVGLPPTNGLRRRRRRASTRTG